MPGRVPGIHAKATQKTCMAGIGPAMTEGEPRLRVASSFCRRSDRHRQVADAGNFALELVARDGGGNAGGRAGQDDVAGAAITSGTFQIICARSPSWRTLPLHLSAMRPLLGCPILAAGCSAPQGADASNDLPISHGRFMSRDAVCRSRRVRSMPTT
jgi:hypothetical protein